VVGPFVAATQLVFLVHFTVHHSLFVYLACIISKSLQFITGIHVSFFTCVDFISAAYYKIFDLKTQH